MASAYRVAAPSIRIVPWAARASCWPLPQQLLPVSATGGGRRRCTLGIFSGKNIYNFAILENLRIFQNCLFTGGVVTESSICSAAFCESAALRETNPLRLTAFASSPKGGAFGSPRRLHLFAKASPFGRGGFAKQRRRGRGRCPCAPNTIFTGGSLLFLRKKSQDLARQAG